MKKPRAQAGQGGGDPTEPSGADGAMLVRLGRVRPAGTSLTEAPATSPAPVPERPRRAPLPQRPQRALKLVERNESIDRLMKASKPRVSGTLISFLVAVILPTLIAGMYFAFVASPQYVSEFRFSVRTEDSVGLSTGSPASQAGLMTALVDNFLIADFVKSRDAVDRLESSVGLRSAYGREEIDFLSRFGSDGSAEELVRYWNARVDSHFDMTTGINIVEVRAFSPEDAHRIATRLRELCEDLVNGLSERARRSQLAFAEDQLERAQKKLEEVTASETAFRQRVQSIDASKSAEATIQLASKLRSDLTTKRAELDTLMAYLDSDSPRVRVLKRELESSERQLAELDGSIDGSDSDLRTGAAATASAIGEFETLRLQKEFAAQIYETSLTAYEHARMRAASNTLYLATYVEPSVPQDATYPRRILDTFLFFLGALAVWVVGTLVFLSVRDHAA